MKQISPLKVIKRISVKDNSKNKISLSKESTKK
jgi:hypothetical protein